MSNLIHFLCARFDEDEAVAREVQKKIAPKRSPLADPNGPGHADYFEEAEGSLPSAYWDRDYLQGGYTITAVRVLREVEAKRRMLASLLPDVQRLASAVENEHGEYESAPDVLLGLLALPYSDHPDYDEVWRP